VFRRSGPHLPAREGSGAATRSATPDSTTHHGRAPELPRVSQLRTPPPNSEGLRCCHTVCSSGLRHPARKGSGAAACSATPDPVSQLGRAPVLPHIPQLRTLQPTTEGLWCYCVFRGFGHRLLAREGPGAVTYPMALSGLWYVNK
jgi:hypothetical protein